MSEEDIQVEIVTLDNKQYKRVQNEEGEFWCIQTIAEHTQVNYRTIYYHLKNKSGIFSPFIRAFQVIWKEGKMRKQLFLQVPEGLDQLRLYVRKLKNNPEMNKIMSFISSMKKGDIVAATKEDVEKLKQAQAQTPHLVLGQDITFILNELKDIKDYIKQINEVKALPDHTQQELMDTDRKKIIAWLFDNMEKEYGVPFYELWWQFSGALGIDNYGKQSKAMFPDMLDFFFRQDMKLVVRAYNWYSSTSNPQEEVKEVFLLLFERDKQKKLTDEDTGVIV